MTRPDGEREAFEAWASDQKNPALGLRLDRIERKGDAMGEYVSTRTHAAWAAWQASRSQAPAAGAVAWAVWSSGATRPASIHLDEASARGSSWVNNCGYRVVSLYAAPPGDVAERARALLALNPVCAFPSQAKGFCEAVDALRASLDAAGKGDPSTAPPAVCACSHVWAIHSDEGCGVLDCPCPITGQDKAMYPACAPPAGPAFKVGDRVRVVKLGDGTSVEVRNGLPIGTELSLVALSCARHPENVLLESLDFKKAWCCSPDEIEPAGQAAQGGDARVDVPMCRALTSGGVCVLEAGHRDDHIWKTAGSPAPASAQAGARKCWPGCENDALHIHPKPAPAAAQAGALAGAMERFTEAAMAYCEARRAWEEASKSSVMNPGRCSRASDDKWNTKTAMFEAHDALQALRAGTRGGA